MAFAGGGGTTRDTRDLSARRSLTTPSGAHSVDDDIIPGGDSEQQR
jgi:hypothetical protein